jgi:23S rRNA pseudouridine2605 synthase
MNNTIHHHSEKLQKVLAATGLGSRREMEQRIAEGRVKVNRQVAKLGDRVSASDEIWLDGRRVVIKAQSQQIKQILCYNKPIGYICSRNDPTGLPSVFDHLPPARYGRWVGVGRLDVNTSGLLFFTNDGELAHRLMHPSSEIEREYAVRVLGQVDTDMLKRLHDGVQLDDGMAHFDRIADAGGEGSNHWYHVTLKEGRRREVRRLWESQGVQVSRLIRIRFGSLLLPSYLKMGRWQLLNTYDFKLLYQQAHLPVPEHFKTENLAKRR